MNIKEWIYRHNATRYLIICIILVLIGGTLIFTQFFGLVTLAEDKALDMLYYYDKATFYTVLDSLTPSDRMAYRWIHIGDYLFILGLYPLFAIGLSRKVTVSTKSSNLIFIPLLAGVFDTTENIIMDIHLYVYPSEFPILGGIAGVVTLLKFTCLFLAVLFLIGIPLIKRMNHKTQS